MLKNYLFGGIAGVLLLSSVVLSSCEKDFDLSVDSPTDKKGARVADRKELIAWNQKYMSALGKYSLLLSRNKDWKGKVYEGVEEKFDGDDNVLIENLFTESSPISSKARILSNYFLKQKEYGLDVNLEEALGAYRNNTINFSKEIFPQIYIPHYKELKESGNLGTKSPVIFIFNPYDKEKKHKVFSLNELGLISEIDEIDEEFSKTNEVWVISINEKVQNRESLNSIRPKKYSGARTIGGDYAYLSTNCDQSGYSAPSPGGTRITVESLALYSHREPWYAGASEVAIEVVSGWGNGHPQTYPYSTYNQTGPSNKGALWIGGSRYGYNKCCGPEFISVSRSDVSSRRYITGIDYDVTRDNRRTTYWGQQNDPRGDCMYYVVYEYDESDFDTGWGVLSEDLRGSTDPNNRNQMTVNIRSDDAIYGRGYIYFNMLPSCGIYKQFNDAMHIYFGFVTP